MIPRIAAAIKGYKAAVAAKAAPPAPAPAPSGGGTSPRVTVTAEPGKVTKGGEGTVVTKEGGVTTITAKDEKAPAPAPAPPPANVGPVTAADVIAQAETLGQTVTPELAATVAVDLTRQGLTPATYVAGVQAAQTFKEQIPVLQAEGKTAKEIIAGETAAVLAAQIAVSPPSPPKILEMGTVTSDITGQKISEELGIPVGSHFARLEGDTKIPVSDVEWQAGLRASAEAVQMRAVPDVMSATLIHQQQLLTAKWHPFIEGKTFIGSEAEYKRYVKESGELGLSVEKFNVQLAQVQVLREATINEAITYLREKGYGVEGAPDSFYVARALASDDPKVIAAINALFTPAQVEAAQTEATIPAPAGLKGAWPKGVPTSIPEGFLSDAEYAKLSLAEVLALVREGKDIRAQYLVKTWEAALERTYRAVGMEKPLEMAVTPVFYGLDPVYRDIKARLETAKAKDLSSGLVSPTQQKVQAELDAYMARWRRGGIETVLAAASIPALITPMPWIGAAATAAFRGIPLLPRLAAGIATLTIRVAPTAYVAATLAEAAQTSNLERKWETFSALPTGEKDFWAKQAGHTNWEALTDSEKAHTLLRYSAPPGVTLAEWEGSLMKVSDEALKYVGKGADWIREHAPAPISEPVAFVGGLVAGALVEAPVYTAMIPILAAHLVDKVPEGEAGPFAAAVVVGMAAFMTEGIPKAFKADPTLTSGRLIGLFVLGPGGFIKLAEGLGARLNIPKYIAERGMAVEYSVVRVPTEPVGDMAMRAVTEALNRALLEGPKGPMAVKGKLPGEWYVELPVGDGLYRLKCLGTAYQAVDPFNVFSGTPDITKFNPANPKGVILWSSPQFARRFAELSATGERATHPGVIQTYLGPEGFKEWQGKVRGAETLTEMNRLALEAYSKGYTKPGNYPPFKDYMKAIELETTSIGPYEAVPGLGGRGVSANIVLGSYPIQRFILKGLGLEGYKGPSFAQRVTINMYATLAATYDAFLGWRGRMDALKRMLKGEAETPELTAYLRNESNLGDLAELIHGRRKALTIELSKDAQRILEGRNAKRLGELTQKERLSSEELQERARLEERLTGELLDTELTQALGKYKKLFDEYLPEIRERGDYTRAYISVYTRALEAGLARGAPREKARPEAVRPRDTFERAIEEAPLEARPAISEVRLALKAEYRPSEAPKEYPPPEERVPPPEERVPPGEERPVEEEYIEKGRIEERRLKERLLKERIEKEIVIPRKAEEEVAEAYRKGLPILLFRYGALHGKDVWKAVIEPATQANLLTVVGTEKLPMTPRKYATGKGSATKTLQWLGRGPRHPGAADIGIADVFWGVEDESVYFKGGGLKTDVGRRLPTPTKGISIPEAEPEGISALPLGSSFAEFLRRVPKDKAHKDFMLARMSEYMSKMTSKQITDAIKEAQDEGYLKPSKRALSITSVDVLSCLPDVERGSIKLEQLRIERETQLAPQFRKRMPKSISRKLTRRPTDVTVGIISLRGMKGL